MTYEFSEEIQKFLMRDWKNSSGDEVACAEVMKCKGGAVWKAMRVCGDEAMPNCCPE